METEGKVEGARRKHDRGVLWGEDEEPVEEAYRAWRRDHWEGIKGDRGGCRRVWIERGMWRAGGK